MRIIDAVLDNIYGRDTAIIETSDLQCEIGDRYDYLVVRTHNYMYHEYMIFTDVIIGGIIDGIDSQRIGFRFDVKIGVSDKPTEDDIVKELI